MKRATAKGSRFREPRKGAEESLKENLRTHPKDEWDRAVFW